MTTMIAEVYDAFKDAGASEAKARAAAEAMAQHDRRFGKIEADLLVLKWMTGFTLAGVTAVVIQSFLN